LISLPQRRQTSKAGARAAVGSLQDSGEFRLLSRWARPGLGAPLPTESWGRARAARTGTPSLSGGTEEGKGLAGARASLHEADPQGVRWCHEGGQPVSLSVLPALEHPSCPGEAADWAAPASQGMTGSGMGQCGPHGCAQLCPEDGGVGEVQGAGQMLVQLLSRGDRWDK